MKNGVNLIAAVDTNAIPASAIRNLSLGLLDVMLRIKKDDPDMWARIKARGKEIDEGGDDTDGSGR